MKIYCMSDIHGCYSALCDALEFVFDHLDEPDTKLIFLGDYIHGGEDNIAVLRKRVMNRDGVNVYRSEQGYFVI